MFKVWQNDILLASKILMGTSSNFLEGGTNAHD